MKGVEVAGLDVHEHIHVHLQSMAGTRGYRFVYSGFHLEAGGWGHSPPLGSWQSSHHPYMQYMHK